MKFACSGIATQGTTKKVFMRHRHEKGSATQLYASFLFAFTFVVSLAWFNSFSREEHGYRLDPVRERAAMLATPLVLADAVQLSPDAIARLRAQGIKQLAVEPIGNSSAAFYIVINGKAAEDKYSTIHDYRQMYKLDFSSDEPRVYVTENIRKTWEPHLVSFYIGKDLEQYTKALNQEAHLREQWAGTQNKARM